LRRRCGGGGGDRGVDDGGESGGDVRAVAKAAVNAIAAAAVTAVAVAMAMVRDGCIGGLAVAATEAGTTMARDDGQHQHSTPPFHPRLVVKCSFSALISDRTKRTQRHTRCVERIYRAGTRVGGA
jgi:hypothetical protein